MSHPQEESLQQLRQAYQRAEADKGELIAQRKRKEKEIRELKVQRLNIDVPFNPQYTEATVHGLTVRLREAGDGRDAKKNAKVAVVAGLLCLYVQKRCDENHQLPLVDVPACLDRAKKDANFCAKEFNFNGDERVTGDLLRTIAPLLVQAQKLNLNGTTVADVAPLAGLTSLQTLGLDNTPVADVAPLAALIGLQKLVLSSTQVADVAPLASLPGLQDLYLGSTQVANVAPLAALIGLQKLNLYNTPLANVMPLAALAGLRELWLCNTPVADVTPLAALTCLRELNLSDTSVADVTPLAALTGLQDLYLRNTHVPRDNAMVKKLKERGVYVRQ